MNENSIVELNVGGVNYTTSLRTILNEPESYFAKLFESDQAELATKDAAGKLFIDRDGALFRYVLDFLRNKALILPENFSERRRLRCEAEFYNLKSMLKQLDEASLTNGAGAGDGVLVNGSLSSLSLNNNNSNGSEKSLQPVKKKFQTGCIVIGYRGTFANGRDGLADVKFRKISRILICGRVQLCREVSIFNLFLSLFFSISVFLSIFFYLKMLKKRCLVTR